MQNYKSNFAYRQGWRDLQVLTFTEEEEQAYSGRGIIYISAVCPECSKRLCIAQGEKFCPRCGYTPELR